MGWIYLRSSSAEYPPTPGPSPPPPAPPSEAVAPSAKVHHSGVIGCGSPIPGSSEGGGEVHSSIVVLSCSGGTGPEQGGWGGWAGGGRESPPACDWWYGSVSEPICHICPCHFASARRLLRPHKEAAHLKPQWPLGLSAGPPPTPNLRERPLPPSCALAKKKKRRGELADAQKQEGNARIRSKKHRRLKIDLECKATLMILRFDPFLSYSLCATCIFSTFKGPVN